MSVEFAASEKVRVVAGVVVAPGVDAPGGLAVDEAASGWTDGSAGGSMRRASPYRFEKRRREHLDSLSGRNHKQTRIVRLASLCTSLCAPRLAHAPARPVSS